MDEDVVVASDAVKWKMRFVMSPAAEHTDIRLFRMFVSNTLGPPEAFIGCDCQLQHHVMLARVSNLYHVPIHMLLVLLITMDVISIICPAHCVYTDFLS